MKVYAQTLELKPDPQRIAEYVRRHQRVWPEVLQGLRAIGIQQMRIYLHANRLFMTIETTDEFDPERDYQRYADDPKTRILATAILGEVLTFRRNRPMVMKSLDWDTFTPDRVDQILDVVTPKVLARLGLPVEAIEEPASEAV